MSAGCGIDDKNAPLLRVRLIGRGEDAMRMDKRLRCAGRALGARVHVDWETDQHGEPQVWIGDQQVVNHLVDTVKLETLLKPFLPSET